MSRTDNKTQAVKAISSINSMSDLLSLQKIIQAKMQYVEMWQEYKDIVEREMGKKPEKDYELYVGERKVG